MIHVVCLLCLSILAGSQAIYAQEYNFLNYNVDEGLAQSQVRDILQDKRGFLWIGTKGGGISQFDGMRFRNSNRYDGLFANEIVDLMEDSRGRIWITHPSGVTLYDGYEFSVIGPRQGLHLSEGVRVAEDSTGQIWLSGLKDGVCAYNEAWCA